MLFALSLSPHGCGDFVGFVAGFVFAFGSEDGDFERAALEDFLGAEPGNAEFSAVDADGVEGAGFRLCGAGAGAGAGFFLRFRCVDIIRRIGLCFESFSQVIKLSC